MVGDRRAIGMKKEGWGRLKGSNVRVSPGPFLFGGNKRKKG